MTPRDHALLALATTRSGALLTRAELDALAAAAALAERDDELHSQQERQNRRN